MRMSCTEAKRMRPVVLAGDASPDQVERLEAHLHACPACAADWQKLEAVAETLRAAAPPALETERDLVRAAMQQIAVRPERRGLRLRPAYRLVAWAAAALVVIAAAMLVLPRPSRSSRLLAVVEAAMADQPTHEVNRTFGADGSILKRVETWISASGDWYYEVQDFARGTRETWLRRAGNGISWHYNVDEGEYALHWDAARSPSPPLAIQPRASDESIPGVRSPEVLWALALLRSGGIPFEVSDRQGRLHGQDTRIIEVTFQLPPEEDGGKSRGPAAHRCYLTPDGSRLIGQTATWPPIGQGEPARFEMYPIDYDTAPPPSLFQVNVPEGARVTYTHEPIDRIWEVMSGAEQDTIRRTAEGFLQAWTNGDVEAFDSYCDFAAGLQYGVKGKFTAEEIGERSAELVVEQKGRFAEQQWTMDYAYETTRPPGMSMSHWHIHRENPQSDGNWILFRQQPIEEPGIAVLARGRVTTHEGDTGNLGMYLFLKEIEGRYKVVLWRPPYGGYGY